MSTDAKVEAQLNQTMARIRRGARPWKLRDRDVAALKKHYRPAFSLNVRAWPKVRGKILRLATYEGALAAVLAESFHGKPQPPSAPVPTGCLWLAAFLVQIGCPPQLSPQSVALGRHCTAVDLAKVDAKTLGTIGRKLIGLSGGLGAGAASGRSRG